MIIAKLKGGLGNQLFQYATARSLAIRHATELIIDATCLDDSRHYMLDRFMITASTVLAEKIQHSNGLIPLLLKPFGSFIDIFTKQNKHSVSIYTEPHFHYDAGIESVPDDTNLDGYWQSERYFKGIEEIIRSELCVKAAADDINLKFAADIRAVNAVSLHVRRGDYASCAELREYHGLCTPDYYQNAVRFISSRVTSPIFFVFSDEPCWVKENLSLEAPMIVISHNGTERGEEDLRLMSLCRHHIIANSSFSWWGAWLNPNRQKIVIAPRRWFNHPGIVTTDLIPPEWIQI